MRKLHPLAIAVPAFVLGSLSTASLTSVAHAQDKVELRRPTYAIATDASSLNLYARDGYEVKEANATATHVWYLMQRYR